MLKSLIARTAALAVAAGVAGPLPAYAAPPSDPQCFALGAGSTGLLAVGGYVPSVDDVTGDRGGFGPAPSRAVAATLPRNVAFRTPSESFSNEYAFALREGRIYVRAAKLGRALPGEPWHRLDLPACLDGRIAEISADHRLLIAFTPDRQMYSHDMPSGDLSADRWTWRWGPYFWTGQGMLMPEARDWATSEFTGAETFTDTSGRSQHPIGVATVYLLREGSRITYLDPWLPTDESREVCGPERGTIPLAGLSGSGSTAFVASRGGALFTRLYDFDVTGTNTVFGNYSWNRNRPASDTRWQLPAADWLRHPRPPGPITNKLTLLKTGPDAADRLLRIEGALHRGEVSRWPRPIDVTIEGPKRRGRTGYWEKPIDASRARDWVFVRTGERLTGKPLRAGRPGKRIAPDDRRYEGTVGGVPVVLRDFNPECTPATLRVRIAPDQNLDLTLETYDGLRQETRRPGLDDAPREYNGAIIAPPSVFRGPGRSAAEAWISANLGGRRVVTAPLAVTATRMRFLNQCWELTLNGDPARADQPPLLPDMGALIGRFTEQQQNGGGPPVC